VPFLKLLGIVAGGWQMARAALAARARVAGGSSDPFYAAKIASARVYADHLMTQAPGLAQTVIEGGAGALALADEQF
jgi:hypothetical protein